MSVIFFSLSLSFSYCRIYISSSKACWCEEIFASLPY